MLQSHNNFFLFHWSMLNDAIDLIDESDNLTHEIAANYIASKEHFLHFMIVCDINFQLKVFVAKLF